MHQKMCTNVHKFKYFNPQWLEVMMMYDIHMHLDSFNTITNDGLEYIATTFNTNT